MKKTSIILLILAFLFFLGYDFSKKADFNVLEVISSTEIVVDLNNNGIKDADEIIELDNLQSFSTKMDDNQSKLARKIKISPEDAIGLGFLAENFAKETLLDKKIKLENENSQIFIGDKNYETLLLNSGYALKKDSDLSQPIRKNLLKVRKLNLKILNNKNHKYHKLTCKYGVLAHNFQILPAFQLPKDAKACNFCFGKHKKYIKDKNHYSKKFRANQYSDVIPDIKSPPAIFSSNSIKIFLTDLTTTLKPSNTCKTPVCRALVQEIDSAQTSIDFAIYGYSKIPDVQCALERAQLRGVNIRFVYDLDGKNNTIYPDTLYLAQILKKNQADHASQIMHDKFFIFDNKKVLTGSANISNTDMSGFSSNAIIMIDSEKIANIYTQEFEQMFNNKFHKQKIRINDSENIPIEDKDFSVYFSPEDKAITCQIIPLINNAQKYIYMPVFLLTHKKLGDALIQAHKRGVRVKVILDATNAHGDYSQHKFLRQNGIPVKTENYAGKLHSKSIVIDDLYTVIGSMNFSKSGENVNDENLLIIKNRDIALFYKTFFEYLWVKIPDKWLKYNARAESTDSIGSCSDGVDNDFDGKIDMADDSCKPYQKIKKK